MKQPDNPQGKSTQGLSWEGHNLKFWDNEYESGKLKFKRYPKNHEISETIHKIDTQQRQFFAERFSNEILFGSQFIINSDRINNRRIFFEIFHDISIISNFKSTLLEISEFFLNGISTIEKTEPIILKKPEVIIQLLGVGDSQKEDPYELNRVFTDLLENNKTNSLEEALGKGPYKEITNFILAKYILSEPVVMKSDDFRLGILYLSFLIPRMMGFDFRVSFSEREEKPKSLDILIQKEIDNFDIILNKKSNSIHLKQYEIGLYRDLWNYFISHQGSFQEFIAARDRKALSESLIEKFSKEYSLKVPLEDLFSTPLGKKIGIKIIKNEIQRKSPDITKHVELIFQRLSSTERKELTRELLDNQVILNNAINQEILSSLKNQDWEIFDILAKFSIPKYSELQSAVEGPFKNLNWDDTKIVDSANALLAHLLSLSEQNCREGWRIVGSSLYNELYSRGVLSESTDKKFSHRYKNLGIPTKQGRNSIFSFIFSPNFSPIIAFIAFIEALIIIILQNPPVLLFSDSWNSLKGYLAQVGDPKIIIGIGIISVIAIVLVISYVWFNERFISTINSLRNILRRK